MKKVIHQTGKLIQIPDRISVPLVKVAREIMEQCGIEMGTQYEDEIECLCDRLPDEYSLLHGKLYRIELITVSEEEEVFRGRLNEDGSISFEIIYQDETTGFDEALENAITSTAGYQPIAELFNPEYR